MIGVIYARFSSEHQTEMSIEAQVRACKEYAEKHNIIIKEIYKDEAKTGTNANREGYIKLLEDAFDNSFDIILIHKYDRIARDLEEQVTLRTRLKKLNIRLVAVAQDYGEGKDAELSKGIQWVLGEYYSANLSEEVKKGHKEIALKAMHNGGVAPFGYDIINQHYVINEVEANYVRMMFDHCIKGLGYNGIIDSMNKANIIGKRGKPIKYTQIYEILRNEKYTGTYIYSVNEEKERKLRRTKPNAIRIENAFPNIIDKATFNKAQDILSSRKRQSRAKHRCSGLVYCAECGSKMHHIVTKRKGHEYSSFYCSAHCGASIVSDAFIDEAVDEYVKEIFSEKNKGEVEIAIRSLNKYNRDEVEQFDAKRKKMLEKAENELKNITDGLMSGAFKNNYEFVNELIINKQTEIDEIKRMKPNVIKNDVIETWISEIVSENFTPGIFIDRIEANTTSIKIYSTFKEVVSNIGCGDPIDIIPTTLLGFKYIK